MTFTFVSNYINHHQMPLCEALRRELGDDFTFIQTMPMEEERVAMGWGVDVRQLPYVQCLYQDEYACRRTIAESDVVLFGWSQREDIAAERLASGRVTMRVSERLYREGQWKAVRGDWRRNIRSISSTGKRMSVCCVPALTRRRIFI